MSNNYVYVTEMVLSIILTALKSFSEAKKGCSFAVNEIKKAGIEQDNFEESVIFLISSIKRHPEEFARMVVNAIMELPQAEDAGEIHDHQALLDLYKSGSSDYDACIVAVMFAFTVTFNSAIIKEQKRINAMFN